MSDLDQPMWVTDPDLVLDALDPDGETMIRDARDYKTDRVAEHNRQRFNTPVSDGSGTTIERLPRDVFDMPRYLHPHGYIIGKEKRSWSERGRPRGRHHDPPPPMYWWTVQAHIARRRSMLDGRPAAFRATPSDRPCGAPSDFATLAEARAWCDAHPREGWTS